MIQRARATRVAAVWAISACLLATSNAQTQKRPLTHADYDAWRAIYTPALTRDGRWVVYSFMPQEGDGDLIIRDSGPPTGPPPSSPRPRRDCREASS